jgi:hypothetical protein
MEILDRYKNIKTKLDGIRTEQVIQDRLRSVHEANIEKFGLQSEEKEKAFEILEKALKIFQKVSDERNKTAKEALETVINWALSKIFTDQSYEMKIEEYNDARSGKTMEVYLIDTNTGKSRSLKLQTGTALAQIVSFLMLLTVIKFADASKVLMLDEVFSGLEDTDAVLMFSDILTSLAKNEGFQIIIVEQNSLISDNPEFKRVNVALENYSEGLIVKKID